jgi:hypothetical protein
MIPPSAGNFRYDPALHKFSHRAQVWSHETKKMDRIHNVVAKIGAPAMANTRAGKLAWNQIPASTPVNPAILPHNCHKL